MFLTFNSEEKSFPFDEWPTTDASEGYSVRSVEEVEDGEIVNAEEIDTKEVANDDIPSFTAEQSGNDDEDRKPAN
jgi:hypothetical protein